MYNWYGRYNTSGGNFENQAGSEIPNLTRVQRKQRDIIFSNRMQSNIIGRGWYLLPFETNMRIQAQPRPAEFRENLDRSLPRFLTRSKFVRSELRDSSIRLIFIGVIGSRTETLVSAN